LARRPWHGVRHPRAERCKVPAGNSPRLVAAATRGGGSGGRGQFPAVARSRRREGEDVLHLKAPRPSNLISLLDGLTNGRTTPPSPHSTIPSPRKTSLRFHRRLSGGHFPGTDADSCPPTRKPAGNLRTTRTPASPSHTSGGPPQT